MEVFESGVSSHSTAYFYTHSTLANDLFFYLLCTGHYFCNDDYVRNRNSYNSFLLMYVANGSGYLQIGSSVRSINTGDFVFIDCYQPHCYGTNSGWEIYWLHFDGILARKYFETCTKNKNFIFEHDMEYATRHIIELWNSFHEGKHPQEALVSKWITSLLTDLLLSSPEENTQTKSNDAIDNSLHFIAENIHRPLLLEDLAKYVSLSPFYFSRLFKKKTGYTPHEYVTHARVDRAKYLLKTTEKPLKEIAYCCGFSNECSFSTIFKRCSGDTPLFYRNYRNEGH